MIINAGITIRIALSTDAKGHAPHATLIASILRRTALPVHVRCWCRGFAPESFESGRLKVEFLRTDEEVTGKFPGYVGPAVFDRLRVIRDAEDWDKCLIMDYDQLALCDLAPLFDLDLGDCLLAAKMQGPGVDMAYAMRTWIKRPLPEGWEHVAEYPYFSMGPLLNLKAMREAGTWEKLMAAHAAFGVDEQLSLTAATEGRTMGFDKMWNLFPKSDIKDGEIPEGVIHWLGWPKPWHKGAKVWRPDIWESEKSSWEHLRMGLWEKPLSIELEPDDHRALRALAQRGWRVKVFSHRLAESGGIEPKFPDVEVLPASREGFQSLLEKEETIDQVRLGAWEDPADWLEGCKIAPDHLVLKGGMDAEEVDRVRALGYGSETRLMSGEWPAGGPLPRALDFREHAAAFEGMDHLFYMDADMRVIGKVGEEILCNLVGTLHPGFHEQPRGKFTYERRRESKAWISPEEGSHYFCGAFQGGKTEHYLEAARVMAEWIDEDAARGITAVWHDESHWNRYLIDRAPSLILSPSYCWYPDGRSKDFEGKIAVVLKDAAVMRK